MKKNKKEVEIHILNGTKVWFWVIGVLLTHGAGSLWWAATLSTKVDNIDKKLHAIVVTVDDNRKEAKQDVKDIRHEMKA